LKVWHDSLRLPVRARPGVAARRYGVVPPVLVPALLVSAAVLLIVLSPTPAAFFLQVALVVTAIALGRSSLVASQADTIVLVGTAPIASVAASLLADRQEQGGVDVLHAATFADAAVLVRSSKCAEVIVADPDTLGNSPLVDARGVHPVVTSGVEAVERLLGRVPLRIDDGGQARTAGTVLNHSRIYAIAKRAVDIAFATAMGLGILLVVPIVALAIRLDSPGPIFYSQLRVGLNGRLFRIYKFRSMRQDAERNGATWAKVGDARVTRVGRFLRLTRIDELPQVWNVLRGDMTLVGPRPERPEFTSLLEAEIPSYAERHQVKPGITGWAQVRYRYTSSVRDAEAKLEYDLFYVKYRSLGLDLRVLLRTVLVVVQMRGC
jgi:exopolysaccharide biosynthesis polyprenyl glycosylphosphotransferase